MDKFLKNLIEKSGNYLLDNFRKDRELVRMRSTSKEAATKYDKILDSLIIEQIQKKYPSHSILTEESGFKEKNSDWLWIVDSLDGTSNFANSNPFFAVCIALIYKNKLVLGAIYAPAINEFYFAKKRKGAFCNGKKIKVSDISKVNKSYLLYCEGGDKTRRKAEKIIRKIYPLVTDLRKIGSAGIETAWVAAGKADAYFTTQIDPWDVAAGILLIEEAGGKTSDFKGKTWRVKQADLLFSNKKIHNKIIKIIK